MLFDKGLRCAIAAVAIGLSGCAATERAGVSRDVAAHADRDEAAIRAVLSAQVDAWNRGDVDGFMRGYWRDEALRFAAGGEVVTGWRTVRDRYATAYADRAAMGELAFSDLDVRVITSDHAIVYGAWALARETDRLSGLFALVFQKIAGDWRIVSASTTSAE